MEARNNELTDIKWILDRLWIDYTKKGSTYWIKENWETRKDWGVYQLSGGGWFVKSFDNQRAEKTLLNFVHSELNSANFKETFEWLEENGFLKKSIIESVNLSALDYLKSRKIFVQNEVWIQNNLMFLNLKNINWDIIGKQYRSYWTKKFYKSTSDGLFFSFTQKKGLTELFLVEGFTDYLSLIQSSKNVLGLKSANTNIDNETIDFINSCNNVFLLFDNDTAWNNKIELLKCKINTNKYVFNKVSCWY